MERVVINCEGLVCPLPIITLKKRLKELAEGTPITIIVDNATAAGNVTAFLKDHNVTVEFAPHQNSSTLLSASFENPGVSSISATAKDEHEMSACLPSSSAKSGRVSSTILCATDALGQGSDELGKILIKGFISTLTDWDPLPARILLINRGVFLAVQDSPTLPTLKLLSEAGTEISICGTCVDYYQVRDRIAVGEIVNMLTISTAISEAEKLVRL